MPRVPLLRLPHRAVRALAAAAVLLTAAAPPSAATGVTGVTVWAGTLWMAQDTTTGDAAPRQIEEDATPLDSSAGEAMPYADDESWDEDEGVAQTLLPAPEATPRAVPEAALARYRADPNFRYDTAGRATGPSLLDRFWDWFTRTYLDPVFERAASRPGRMTLAIAGILALLALLVWLARGGDIGVFRRRDGDAAMPYGGFLDAAALGADDLDARLADARAAGQWRAATRWRFLVSLRRLGAAGVLRLDAHKTDGDYRREIRRAGRPLARAFADAADAFAWVWYGAAALDADRFARGEATFDRLDAALANRATPPRAAAVDDTAAVPAGTGGGL